MINALLGIKKQMTSTYDSRGRRVGATVVEMSANLITQVKSKKEKDGYDGIQLGYGTKKSVKKPQIGHVKKAGVDSSTLLGAGQKYFRWFREVRTSPESAEGLKPGTEIKLDQVFSIGDSVKVTGTSKGRGFAGVVKRHGFHGGPKTHGQSDRLRAPGSIGSGTTPGRVYKGKKMAGHMGNRQVSTKGLEVLGVDKEKNLLTIKGAVPGSSNGLIMVTNLGRIKGYTPPPEEKIEESDKNEELSEKKIVMEPPSVDSDTTESVQAKKEEENAQG